MNIKIQGGGSGTYANTGSCTGVTTYLQHEDLERMKNQQQGKIKPERCEVLCDHGKPFQPGAGENGQDRERTG